MSNWPDLEFVCSTNSGSVFAAEFARQRLLSGRKGFEKIEVTSSGLLVDSINNPPNSERSFWNRVLPYLRKAREIELIDTDSEEFVRKFYERTQEYFIRATEEFNVCCIKDYKPRQTKSSSDKNLRIIWAMSSQQTNSVRMVYSGNQQPLVLILKDEEGNEIQDPLFAKDYGQYHGIINLLRESVASQMTEFISYGPKPIADGLNRGEEYL